MSDEHEHDRQEHELERPAMRQRRQLLEAVADALQLDDEWAGKVVSGFALVVELVGPDGGRGIAARSSDATGDTDLTPWAAEGLLRYALGEGMFESYDPDDDDDE